jgi:ribosomal protein S18 acetylase RimI-like enzyme
MKKLNTKPDFKTEVKGCMFNCIVEIDNPYLQAWADAGAYVMSTGGDFWLMTGIGQLWFKIQEDSMRLECIAVHTDDRRQGNGSELMRLVTEFSDETGIKVSLEVSDVSNSTTMSPHPVVGIGQKKKNKIPVASLPKWYQKFGFTKSPLYTAKKKEMIYTPKTK